jgi:hypothetical protein
MKRIFFLFIVIIFFASCEDRYNIEFDKNLLEVDYQAQEIILSTNEDISMVTYNIANSDTELGQHYTEDGIMYSIGDWFVISLNMSNPRHINISVQENLTDKDRHIEVCVSRDAGSDSALIIQKAKPTE